MKRSMLVMSLAAALSLPLTVLAQPASAGSSCTGSTAVGHGIAANLCLSISYTNGIGVVSLSGTSVSFNSNPLVLTCKLVSTIYDYDTGQPTSNDGTSNEGQCIANADEHKSWTPNATFMAETEPCTHGHRYYAVMDIVATDINRSSWTTAGQRTPNFVTC